MGPGGCQASRCLSGFLTLQQPWGNNRVHVIFLHRGSASKDGTERDGELHESQSHKKMQPGVLPGEQKED